MTSTIVLLLLSNLLILLATQYVDENNADILLAGYNTMSKKEKKFNFKGYLIFFKNFFWKLVLYSSLTTIISSSVLDEFYIIIVYCTCILIPLPFFIIKSNGSFRK